MSDIQNTVRRAAIKYGVDSNLMWGIKLAETGRNSNSGIVNSEGKREGVMQIQRSTWATVRPGVAYSLDDTAQAETAAILIRQLQSQLRTSDPHLLHLAYARGAGTAQIAKAYMNAGASFELASQRAIRDVLRKKGIQQSRDPNNPTSTYHMTPQQFEDMQVRSYIRGAQVVNQTMMDPTKYSMLDTGESPQDDAKPKTATEELIQNCGSLAGDLKCIQDNPIIIENLVKAWRNNNKKWYQWKE